MWAKFQRRPFWLIWTTLYLVLAWSVFVVGKFTPRKKERPASDSHLEWLRLQRQEAPYAQDDDRVNVTSLKLVQVLFRHGARTPYSIFPTDPNANHDYGVKGLGQLTKEGKRQAFELGEYLRDRYDGYFEPNYSFDEVYAQSSDFDRTIMTTDLCLAGLFAPRPPNQRQNRWIFRHGEKNQVKCLNSSQPEVFPVRSIPGPIDNKFNAGQGWACSKKDKLYTEAMNSPKMVKMLKDDDWIEEYLREKTGFDDVGFEQMANIGFTLVVEDLNDLPLPKWTEEVYPEKLQEILRIGFTTNTSNSEELSKFQVGPLMAQFVQNMELRLGETLSSKWTREDLMFYHSRPAKGYFFGGHDSTIASILDALLVYDGEQPAYTSAIILELHGPTNSTQEEDYTVKMFYKKERGESITELDLPKCQNPCSLADFKDVYKDLIMGDGEWEKECRS